jgi:hypothetical protein
LKLFFAAGSLRKQWKCKGIPSLNWSSRVSSYLPHSDCRSKVSPVLWDENILGSEGSKLDFIRLLRRTEPWDSRWCVSSRLEIPEQRLNLIRLVWTNSLFSVCHFQRLELMLSDDRIGDSITQGAWDQSRGFAMGAELASAYSRRFDVMNRGFSYACPSTGLESSLIKALQRL